MKNIKKLITLILALLMILTVLPMAAYAGIIVDAPWKQGLFGLGDAGSGACSSFYMGKDTTENGSYIWGRSEDISGTYSKLFKVHEAEDHAPGDMYITGQWNTARTVYTTGFRWPYPSRTLRYTICADSTLNERREPEPYGEVGTNEKGVSISATVTLSANRTTIRNADPFVAYTSGGLDEMDVASVVLMQAETARGACELVANIIDVRGASSGGAGMGEGFMVSDPNEVWFFQWLSGHQYIAVKCPDDRIGFSPNIMGNVGDEEGWTDLSDTENVIASPRLVSLPKGLNVLVSKDNDTKIKIADTYSNSTTNYRSGRMRVGYGYLYGLTTSAQVNATLPATQYLNYFAQPRPDRKYSLYEAMRLLGCRGEGTEWVQANPTNNTNSIGNTATVETHVFENRPDMPPELATVKWICLAPAEFGVYLPYFGNLVTEMFVKNYSPDTSSYNSTNQDNNSMYRIFRELYTQCAVSNANDRARYGDGVRAFWEKYQKSLIEQQDIVDRYFTWLLSTQGREAVEAEATELSMSVAEQTYEYAKRLITELRAFKAANTSGNYTPSFSALPDYAGKYIYDVTFTDTDDTVLGVQSVGFGACVQAPEAPEWFGYTLTGWNLDEEPYDFDATVSGPFTLVAQWSRNPITSLKISDSDGVAIAPMVTLARGYTYQFDYVINADALREGIVWSVSNPAYAIIDENAGRITILNKTGTVTLIAKDTLNGATSNIVLRIV